MSSRSGRRRDRSYSRSRSPRRRRHRHSSPSSSSSEDSDRHHRSRRGGEKKKSDRRHHHHRRRRDHSSERSRPRDRYRSRSRSRSSLRDSSNRKKDHRRHSNSSRSRSRERTKSKKQSRDKEKISGGKVSGAKEENPAEALKARVKALLAKSSEGTGKVPSLKDSEVSALTPGQTSLIESNSFTSDKFVSKRSSKKWDVPPSGVAQKKTVSAAKKFDVTAVDPSEFVPKVVPMCEVESALGREEGGGGGGDEEGGKGVVSIRQETASETEPVDRNQKWLQKLKKMRRKFADPQTN